MATPVQISPYWEAVSRISSEFNGSTVFITSLPNAINRHPGGAVCEASPRVAAQRIAENSHKIATPVEVEKFKADQATRALECEQMEVDSGRAAKQVAMNQSKAAAYEAMRMMAEVQKESQQKPQKSQDLK